jgi:exosortase
VVRVLEKRRLSYPAEELHPAKVKTATVDILPVQRRLQTEDIALRPLPLIETKHWIWIVLLLAGPLPMLLKMGRFLWEHEQYQFFPLMIVGAVFLAIERFGNLQTDRSVQPGSRGISALLLAVAIVFQLASALVWVQALAGLATICIIASIAWRLGGSRILGVVGPSLVLLLTILPPPGGTDQRITLQLQQIAVRISSQMLDDLHVPHVQAGNVLEIPGRRLLVEQACSGINSLMAVLAFTLLYGFRQQRPIWRILFLLPFAGLFVLWGNIARITGEAWLKVVWNIDWLEGPKHQMMGLFLFVGCVGLVLSLHPADLAGPNGPRQSSLQSPDSVWKRGWPRHGLPLPFRTTRTLNSLRQSASGIKCTKPQPSSSGHRLKPQPLLSGSFITAISLPAWQSITRLPATTS